MEIKTYPIKAVANKTGISIHTIRAWEKRYHAVVPQRTDSNRRYYTDRDIEKLLLLNRAIAAGHNIGSVGKLGIDELKKLIPEADDYNLDPNLTQNNAQNESESLIQRSLNAIKHLDAEQFENILLEASLNLNHTHFLNRYILPLIEDIGEQWHSGTMRIMHEHMATNCIKTFLSNMRQMYRVDSQAPSIIVATPLGQNHDLGAIIIALAAAAKGFRVTYIGANLPMEEIISAVEEKNASSVFLSLIYPESDPILRSEIQKLHTLKSKNVSVIVGGAAVKSYASEFLDINAFFVQNLNEFYTYSSTIFSQHLIQT